MTPYQLGYSHCLVEQRVIVQLDIELDIETAIKPRDHHQSAVNRLIYMADMMCCPQISAAVINTHGTPGFSVHLSQLHQRISYW